MPYATPTNPYAVPDDVEGLLGRSLTDGETSSVQARLVEAEGRILQRIPDLAGQIEDDSIDVHDVIRVEADAALRLVGIAGRLQIPGDDWETLGVHVGLTTPGLTANEKAALKFSTGG